MSDRKEENSAKFQERIVETRRVTGGSGTAEETEEDGNYVRISGEDENISVRVRDKEHE